MGTINIPRGLKYRSIKDLVFIFMPGRGNHVLKGAGAHMWNSIVSCSCTIQDIINQWTTGVPTQASEEIERREKAIVDFINKLYNLGLVSFARGDLSDPNYLPRQSEVGNDTDHDMDNILNIGFEQNIPIVVDVNVTNVCNLRCLHCYAPLIDRKTRKPNTSATHRCKEPFNLDCFKELLRQLADSGCFYLTMTGGEIFTFSLFLEIFEYASKLNFAIRLVTNGTMINAEVADELQKLHPRLINISIHGAKPETHDKVTGVKGSFAHTVKALKMLKERGLTVSIIHVVTKLDVAEARDVRDLAVSMEVPLATTPIICPTAEGEIGPVQYRISDEDLRQLMLDGLYRPQRDICTVGKRCTISPYGDVSPCLFLQNAIIGDLRRNSLEEIWNSEKMSLLRESIDFRPPSECIQCESFDYCPRCPAMAFYEDGDFRKPSSEACRISKIYRSIANSVTVEKREHVKHKTTHAKV